MAHRDNMLDKIGLRGSHFTLGANNANPYITTNSTTYNNQPKVKQMPNIREERVEDLVQHDKANLRASHFALGTAAPETYYFTTNSVNLKHHDNVDRAVLSEEQRKDLRTHHFKMGQYAPTTKTMYTLKYDKKELVEMKDQEKLKAFMRGHHHNFREMPNTIMTTKYNDDYNQEMEKEALKQGITQEQMREKALALRHSHIILGKEHLNMKSVSQQDYTKKHNVYKPMSKDLQSSHFQLGNQKDSMCTTNDMYHTQQPIISNPLAEETMKDLRSSHFKLGQEGLSYQTEFAGKFTKQSDARQSGTISTAALQQNHFSLGNNDHKSTFQTVYQSTMTRPQTHAQQNQARDQKQDRGSNFTIGNQGSSYVSEFSSNYKHSNGQPSHLNEAQKANLRRSHFEFSDVPANNYQTLYKQSYQNRDIKDGRGKIEGSISKELRQNHFILGNQQMDYKSTSHRVHMPPVGATKSVLNAQQQADLRTHHFKLG